MKKDYIFSKFSNVKDFSMLILQLDDGEYISYEEIGPYTTANVLIYTIKEMPEPLFTYAQFDKLMLLPGINFILFIIFYFILFCPFFLFYNYFLFFFFIF